MDAFLLFEIGTRGGVRTCDLFLRREALYPAELREHKEPEVE